MTVAETAMRVIEFSRANDLVLPNLTVRPAIPGSRWGSPNGSWQPVLAQVSILLDHPRRFVDWGRAVTARKVGLHRRSSDTTLHIHVNHHDITWSIGGYMPHRGGRRLPGITVGWSGDHAVITLDELVTAMDALQVTVP